MKFKVSDPRMLHEYGVGWTLSFHVESDSVKRAQEVCDRFRQKQIAIDPTEWKEHRSLSQNAYFHVLVGKIAECMNMGEDEVKRDLVLNYGAQMYKDGDPVGLKLPENIKPEEIGVKYAKWYDVREERGKMFNCFKVFAETHTYDTKQMSRLVDGTIEFIKTSELPITTLTPRDLELMREKEWNAQKNKSTENQFAS